MRRAACVVCSLLQLVSANFAAYVDDGAVRIACVGDSITRGDATHELGVKASAKQRSQLRARAGRGNYPTLLGAKIGGAVDVRNFGHGGATGTHGKALSYTALPECAAARPFAPHVSLWMLGTNDSKEWNASRFARDLAADVAQSACGAAHVALLLSPPPILTAVWGLVPQIVMEEVPRAVEAAAALARLGGVDAKFYNLGARFAEQAGCLQVDEESAPSARCAAHFVNDKVHTSELGALLIARLAHDALRETGILLGQRAPTLTNGSAASHGGAAGRRLRRYAAHRGTLL